MFSILCNFGFNPLQAQTIAAMDHLLDGTDSLCLEAMSHAAAGSFQTGCFYSVYVYALILKDAFYLDARTLLDKIERDVKEMINEGTTEIEVLEWPAKRVAAEIAGRKRLEAAKKAAEEARKVDEAALASRFAEQAAIPASKKVRMDRAVEEDGFGAAQDMPQLSDTGLSMSLAPAKDLLPLHSSDHCHIPACSRFLGKQKFSCARCGRVICKI
jgi:hypothetical protein